MVNIFIWTCSCGYVELWKEFPEVPAYQEDSKPYFVKECPKCEGRTMVRQEPLKE